MAGKRRTLASLVLLVAGYLLVVGAVRTWRTHAGAPVAAHPAHLSTAPATHATPVLSDSDLPAYDFLLRETENPRPHRRPAKTQPTTVTLQVDPSTAPTTLPGD